MWGVKFRESSTKIPGICSVIQMAPSTVAMAFWCAVFFVVLCVNVYFCHVSRSSFTRDELLNIRTTTPSDLLPTFLAPSVDLLGILVKGALPLLAFCIDGNVREGKGPVSSWVFANEATAHHCQAFFSLMYTMQQNGWTTVTVGEKQRPLLCICLVFHGNLAMWKHTGLCATAG